MISPAATTPTHEASRTSRLSEFDPEALVRSHLPLVHHLVREIRSRVPAHVQRDDLVSAAMFALASCAQSYDPSMNVGFATYARLRIRGALIDELRSMDWASRSVRQRAREIDAARAHLAHGLGSTPDNDAVARHVGMTRAEVDEVDQATSRASVVSLHTLSPESGADTLVSDTAGPETLLLRREEFGEIRDAVTRLPERLRFVVEQYFFGHRRMSDIADELGVTESRVSQLRSQALRTLRAAMLDQDRTEGTALAVSVTEARHIALAARRTLARRLEATTMLAEPRRVAHAAAR